MSTREPQRKRKKWKLEKLPKNLPRPGTLRWSSVPGEGDWTVKVLRNGRWVIHRIGSEGTCRRVYQALRGQVGFPAVVLLNSRRERVLPEQGEEAGA